MTSAYDCTRCGACCFGAGQYVQVFPDDAESMGEARLAEFVDPPVGDTPASVGRPAEPRRFMRMQAGHCAALRTDGEPPFLCGIYEARPLLCRALQPGSSSCLEARARRGIDPPASGRPGSG